MVKENRTEQIQTRFTPTERKAIEAKASEEGRTVANLIHTIVMNYVKK
jgi:hypothetical protein